MTRSVAIGFDSTQASTYEKTQKCLMHYRIQLAHQISVFTCMFILSWRNFLQICEYGLLFHSYVFCWYLFFEWRGKIFQHFTSASTNISSSNSSIIWLRVVEWVDARCFCGYYLFCTLVVDFSAFICHVYECTRFIICPSLHLVCRYFGLFACIACFCD